MVAMLEAVQTLVTVVEGHYDDDLPPQTIGTRLVIEEFALDTKVSIEQQVERLALFVSNLRKWIDQELWDVRVEALRRVRGTVDRVEKGQKGDLQWAAVGLLITAVGIAIGYGT
jgi:hypothetical protein